MYKQMRSRGFTLIELLVVIAIIAILAAILFPVFAKARQKAYESTCINNQRQIALTIMIWAQDHSNTYPTYTSAWNDLNMPAKSLICPTAGAAQLNAYGYSFGISNKNISDSGLNAPQSLMLTADVVKTDSINVIEQNTDVAMRHSGNKAVMSYGDGHVALTNIVPPFISFNLSVDEWAGFPATTSVQGFPDAGYSNPSNNGFPPGWDMYSYPNAGTMLNGGTFNPLSPGAPLSAGPSVGNGSGFITWARAYAYFANIAGGVYGIASLPNLAFTKNLNSPAPCLMWVINFDNITNWEAAMYANGTGVRCDNSIDVIDVNGKVISRVEYKCVPGAGGAALTGAQSSVLLNGQTVLPVVTGATADPFWGYGYTTQLGWYNLSISGGSFATGASTSCSIQSITTPSIGGSATASLVDPTADVTQPYELVIHVPDSNTGAGSCSIKCVPEGNSGAGAFNFQYLPLTQ